MCVNNFQEAHGRKGSKDWDMPKVARYCEDQARMGYQSMSAHEFLDTPEVEMKLYKHNIVNNQSQKALLQ